MLRREGSASAFIHPMSRRKTPAPMMAKTGATALSSCSKFMGLFWA